MEKVHLYQFELCPFCHKVKAGLEIKGIPFEKIEVNPMNKKELPELPSEAPRKVPVLKAAGRTIYDSTTILDFLEERYPASVSFKQQDPTAESLSREIEAWVDDELTFALPTVIYGTMREAMKAAQVTARTSNFGFFQNIAVRAGGSLIMHQVSKRILKKRGKESGHVWVRENLDQIEKWLGNKEFLTGSAPALADVSVHGALTCVAEFPVFKEVLGRSAIAAWYERISDLREKNRAS